MKTISGSVCQYDCYNKNSFGFCKTPACINRYYQHVYKVDSVYETLVKILDTNFGYVDVEKAETVAKRIMKAGIIREEKPQNWVLLFNALDGTKGYRCPVCTEIELRRTNFCPNCGAKMVKERENYNE